MASSLNFGSDETRAQARHGFTEKHEKILRETK
jgi:hypothetical protein